MEMENYIFGDNEPLRKNTVYALVIYDIEENRKRTKLAKFLNGYGNRVQKSAFEVCVTKKKFNELKAKLQSFCGKADSIRVYKLSGQSEVTKMGIDNYIIQEDIILI